MGGNLARFLFFCFSKARSVSLLHVGVFSFLFLYVHTNSLTPPLFFLSHPSLRRERELLLGCSWCKSPAQTTRACQQSVADSSNPLFAVVLSRASLSQGSGSRCTANVHRLCSETHREHLHYVSSEPVTYIMVRWGGPSCIPYFNRVSKESSLIED